MTIRKRTIILKIIEILYLYELGKYGENGYKRELDQLIISH